MKFYRSLLPALIATSLSPFVNAYQFEASAGYADYYDGTVTETQLRGTYYFSRVVNNAGPLAEAAFLGRNSSINLAYSDFDSDFDNQDSKSAWVSYFIPNSIFFAGVEYTEEDDENDATFNLGITPVDGLLITTQHNKEADDYNANIYAKYVMLFDDERALNIEAAAAKDEWTEENNYLLSGDFYFNRNFSIGAAFSDDDLGNTYGLSAQHFFIENFSVSAEYYYQDTNDEYDAIYDNFGSTNAWTLALTARF